MIYIATSVVENVWPAKQLSDIYLSTECKNNDGLISAMFIFTFLNLDLCFKTADLQNILENH